MTLLRAAASWFVDPDEPPLAIAPAAPGARTPDPARPGAGASLIAVADDAAAWAGGPRLETVHESPPTRTIRRQLAAIEPTRIAVLGSPTAAPPLAAAVALAQRVQAGTASAAVALWRPAGLDDALPPGPAAPALPGAAALASRLSRRGLRATARGRLIWLLLPTDGDEGADALRHAEAAAGDVPVVLALARPRDPATDAALADRDLAIVAAPPGSPLAAAALDDVADLRIPARAFAPLPAGATRLAALAGLRAPTFEALATRRPELATATPGEVGT